MDEYQYYSNLRSRHIRWCQIVRKITCFMFRCLSLRILLVWNVEMAVRHKSHTLLKCYGVVIPSFHKPRLCGLHRDCVVSFIDNSSLFPFMKVMKEALMVIILQVGTVQRNHHHWRKPPDVKWELYKIKSGTVCECEIWNTRSSSNTVDGVRIYMLIK